MKNLFTGQQWRKRHRKQTYGHGERGREGKMCGKSNMETYITISKIANRNLLCGSGNSNRGLVSPQRGGVGWAMGGKFKGRGYMCCVPSVVSILIILSLGSSIPYIFYIYKLIYDICLSLSDLLYSLELTQMHSFLWLNNIPFYICTTASLSIHLSMDILSCFYVLS